MPPLDGAEAADLAVIGGGFSGLWTALLAKERDPRRNVVLVEGRRIAWAGTGRNGGFCSASLTHGLANGLERFPAELPVLDRLGRENLDQIEAAVARYEIDCDFARTGELTVATEEWQLAGLAENAAIARDLGAQVRLLDGPAVRSELHSPNYLGGLWDVTGCATVDPARLAWGLRRACLAAGVRVYEHTPVLSIGSARVSDRLVLRTPSGSVLADRVALAPGAFAPLLRRLKYYLVPVYDYVLMTRPLSRAQLASIGWQHRQGVGDAGNQFHYYRLTADNRILWGGYDAVYYYGSKIAARLDQRPPTFAALAAHFCETFPQLDGLEFTHQWGGVIDTCSRFCAFFGTARSGRLAYVAGYTGLGVGASRFGASVMLDLLSGSSTELTELNLVKTKPLPFPPEPVRAAGIGLTRWSLARADRREGRRNPWLRALDQIGLGFDS
ncbi:MAG TPA: FAD-dependent oxidoreductase [Streptosporangiaceae bacterium]|nr:FAD-dependent oxidoreductase [Streptosporangiaceae bacterium]